MSKRPNIYTYKCSVCGKKIIGLGNDPRPIRENKNDWCCDECDKSYVQPAKRLFKYLESISKVGTVVLRFDGCYLGIKRRFDCWEYWIADDGMETIDEGVYDNSSAPMTKVVKDLMETHSIVPSSFELLEPDPYDMMEYM